MLILKDSISTSRWETERLTILGKINRCKSWNLWNILTSIYKHSYLHVSKKWILRSIEKHWERLRKPGETLYTNIENMRSWSQSRSRDVRTSALYAAEGTCVRETSESTTTSSATKKRARKPQVSALRWRESRAETPRAAVLPKLKGSIGEGSNHSNFSDRSSVQILSE